MDGFGERLKETRKARGYNQKQFAGLLEITPTRLNYWENNKREPDFFMFSKIVKLLNTDANQLLGLDIDTSMDKYEQQLIEDYRKLNELGQKKAKEYIKDLTENPKYLKSKQEEKIIQKEYEPFSGPRPAQVAAYGHSVMDVDNK